MAAAAAEVDGAAVAGFAGSLHPVFAAEFLEGFVRTVQISRRLLVFHIGELQAGNDFCGVAGECFAVWRDQHQFAAPAAHAGFRIFRVVVGDYGFDADFAAQAFFGALDYPQRTIQLRASG